MLSDYFWYKIYDAWLPFLILSVLFFTCQINVFARILFLGKRPSRKKKPLSGVLTKQMIEAKEAERRRINEVIQWRHNIYQNKILGGKCVIGDAMT